MTWADCETILKGVGTNVRRNRIRLGLTQDELAKRTRVFSRTSIANIEAGRQKMTILTLVAVAAALGVEPGDILKPLAVSEDLIEIEIGGRKMMLRPDVVESILGEAIE